jgi:hypothetical protein
MLFILLSFILFLALAVYLFTEEAVPGSGPSSSGMESSSGHYGQRL